MKREEKQKKKNVKKKRSDTGFLRGVKIIIIPPHISQIYFWKNIHYIRINHM